MAEQLADNYPKLDDLIKAKQGDLIKIDSIGPNIANSICEFFKNDININNINKLKELGVNWPEKNIIKDNNINNHINKKIFVITGKFESFSREDLADKIKSLGGKVTSSVSKNTDVLLCGENAGSKLSKAEKLDIEIWNEDKINIKI